MKGFKEVYKSIFYHFNEHGSHENSFYISNMHWIYFIPNQLYMNILHGHKPVRLPYNVNYRSVIVKQSFSCVLRRSDRYRDASELDDIVHNGLEN